MAALRGPSPLSSQARILPMKTTYPLGARTASLCIRMALSVCLPELPQQENPGINPAAIHSDHSLWAW